MSAVHPQAPSRVLGDPGRLQQVLMNLTSNALKFTDRGQITIRAVVENESPTHETMRFTVDDTGIGIPTERMDRLFRSFSQVDASTTRRYGGTGLGLAICKRLVELMAGTIGVSTEPDLGSTFWFTVKFVRASTQGRTLLPIGDDLRNIRVLAVDDNVVNREILYEQLSGCGICTQTVCDGQRALDALLAAADCGAPMSVAILDMNMPGLDGEQLARAIKSNPELRDTILIMLPSGEASQDDERLRALGFAAWLAKPVTAPRLLDVIASALACAKRTHSQLKSADPSPNGTTPALRSAEAIRILLVDDNEIGREFAFATLAQSGYCCDMAKDGREAVEAAQRLDYDIILMDCQMPNMDGFDATRAIRQSEAARAGQEVKRVLIVALTANAIAGDRERRTAAGMDEYLTKPFAADDLTAMIQRLTTRKNITATEPVSTVINMAVRPVETAKRLLQPGGDSEPAPFNVDAILKRWGGDRPFAAKLIKMFQSQAPDFITGLQRHIAAGDHVETGNVAHGLKGAATYVSAEAVWTLAEQLERMGRDADLSAAPSYLERIEGELKRCLLFHHEILRPGDNESLAGSGVIPCIR